MDSYFAFLVLISGIVSGMILFQSAVVAPTVFTKLPEEGRGPFLRSMFPKLFKITSTLGLLFLIIAFVGGKTSLIVYIVGGVTLIAGLVCNALIPATNRAKDTGNNALFAKLHKISVLLTMAVLIGNLAWTFLVN